MGLPSLISQRLKDGEACVAALASSCHHSHYLPRLLPRRTARLQVAACGKSSLAALADWKPPAVTPLSEPKLRVARGGQGGGDKQSEAFTAAAVSSLFDR